MRLAWLPAAGATGYKVYVREEGRSYSTGIDVGLKIAEADGVIRHVVANVGAGVRTYFAVTAYNDVESPLSNEISIILGPPTTPTGLTLTPTTEIPATPNPPVPTATPSPLVPTPTRTATRVFTPTAPPSGPSQICGNVTQRNGNLGDGWNDTVDGIACTSGEAPAGYRVESCRVYAEVASGNIRCGLYDDRADPNKALLCQSASVPAAPGWNTLPLVSCPIVPAKTTLWVTINTDSVTFRPGLTTGSCDQPAGASYYRFVNFGPFPSAWGSRLSDTCALSLHVLLTEQGGGSTPTATLPPANTATSTRTPTLTPTRTNTALPPTSTPAPSDTPTATATRTLTFTSTPLPTSTASPTWTPSWTPTETPTATHTLTPTSSYTFTPRATQTSTYTFTPTSTPSYTATFTATTTHTVAPTASHSPSVTATHTPEASATAAPEPTDTELPTPMPTAPATPTTGSIPNTASPTFTPSASPTPPPAMKSPTASPTRTYTPTRTPRPKKWRTRRFLAQG